jgi:hypothetical protein
MACPSLIEHMVGESRNATTMSTRLAEAVTAMFESLSSDGKRMVDGDIDRWLLVINKSVERGSEMRAAKAILAAKRESGQNEVRRCDYTDRYLHIHIH